MHALPEPRVTRPKAHLGRALAIAVATLCVPVTALSHDYWLAQEPPSLEAGDRCILRLQVGDRLEAEIERPLQREITTRFEWVTAAGSEDLLKNTPDGARPVFERYFEREQTGLLVMDRDFVDIETDFGQFREFLEHEEATELLERVAEVPQETAMRRRYARNLKALIRVGAGDGEPLSSRPVGQQLEILLLDDLDAIEQGEHLNIRILFDGEPLDDQLVRSFVGGEQGLLNTQTARTDAKGQAAFRYEHRGLWVLRVAYLRPCEDCEGTVWDTHYATFSLQM